MASPDLTYAPPTGAPAGGSRAAVLLHWGWREALRSKAVWLLLDGAGVVWLIFAILIYLHYNLAALRALDLDVARLLPISAPFFATFMTIEAAIAFVVALLVAPPLLTRDLANNGLALYFSRPLSRLDYCAGKMAAPLLLLSAVTWGPGLALFALQAYLAGTGWAAHNARIAAAIVIGGSAWVVLLTLLAFALAAWLKKRLAASAAFVGLLFIPGLVAAVIDTLVAHRWGNLISPVGDMQAAWAGLFGLAPRATLHGAGARALAAFGPPPLWSSWAALGVFAALCIWLLALRLRAYEEVRG